jgi:anthranilate phosphoribosyltransferase
LFLYAPTFHPAMAHIAPIRRLLGCRTVFNVLGPLLNPVDYSLSEGLEARVLGVGKTSLGRTYADTLRLLGVQKAVVVCGEEDLDEVSIAGRTRCWRITPGRDEVEEFWIHPVETFGVDAHPLRDVAGGHGPEQNAAILRNILAPGGEGLKSRDPVSDFVLVNAALVVVAAGLVDSDETGEEVGKDGVMRGAKWKRAINLVRCAVDSGDSWRCWEKFVDISIHGREVGVF